jgi:Mn2+/Fe2+ NRAMP family transporter
MAKKFTAAITGAAFLMATSAIGPGFLTQTAVFTSQLAASFGFIILISILLDIGAQLNIWTVLAVYGMKAQDVANEVLPGLGYLLAGLVVMGGLAFNIGNLAGAGLGMEVLLGIPAKQGAAISAVLALMILLTKNSGKWMDMFTKALGMIMIVLTVYVCYTSAPPLAEAAYRSIIPETIDAKAIITLVGGTVGGYISFAGAHRLLDSGIKGVDSLPSVRRSAVSGILLASVMRVLLFLAAFGVISKGLSLEQGNPAASVFQQAAGALGYKLFGIVMWSAAITSVVGSVYTSYSFMSVFHPRLERFRNPVILAFVILSLLVFIIVGQPVKILVFVGMLNGFILPLALTAMLIAAYRLREKGYRHPLAMYIFGIVVVVATASLSIRAMMGY